MNCSEKINVCVACDDKNPMHIRYNTTGTSGNFQLVYGFLKPCVIIESFSEINGFDDENSILYKSDEDYENALIKAITMTSEDYSKMQKSLEKYEKKLYQSSLNNFRNLIERKQNCCGSGDFSDKELLPYC